MEKRRLVYAITKFLRGEINSDEISSVRDERLEIAIECLEDVFDVSSTDASMDVGVRLDNLFGAVLKTIEPKLPVVEPVITDEAEDYSSIENERQRKKKFNILKNSQTRSKPRKCCVKDCGLTSDDNVGFHRLPVNMKTCMKWKNILGLQRHVPANGYRVCATHFSPLQKSRAKFRGRLKTGAVPDMNLPVHCAQIPISLVDHTYCPRSVDYKGSNLSQVSLQN